MRTDSVGVQKIGTELVVPGQFFEKNPGRRKEVLGIEFTPSEVSTYYAIRVPDLKQSGGEWRGPCPNHKGTDANFAVEADTGLWTCHSRCGRGGDILALEVELTSRSFQAAKAEVYRIVGRPDISPQSLGREIRQEREHLRQTAEYVYQDEAGLPLCRVVRKEAGTNSNRRKQFVQYRWSNGKWTAGVDGVRRVPYRLPKLLNAQEVFLVEGEKDVESLELFGLVASCNSGGSGSTKLYKEWTSIFAGKDIVIIPDNDLPGRKHAAGVAEALIGTSASIRIVDLPGLAERGDATDWIKSGGTSEKLRTLVEAADKLSAESLVGFRTQWGLLEAPDTSNEPGLNSIPFEVNGQGVFWLRRNSDGEGHPIRIAARVDVVAQARDADGENWSRLLRWADTEGRIHEWLMPLSMLAGDSSSVCAHLLSGGLSFLSPGRGHKDRFIEYLQTSPVGQILQRANRIGWHGDCFALPSGPISSGDVTLVYQPPDDHQTHWQVAGTLPQWRESVGRLCSGNSRLVLAVSCAFAGPLLFRTGGESGGIHFVGGTSTGKSTALVVGGSVCGGGGSAGFCQTWRATTNGLEAVAEGHNDGTLFLDELAQVDGREAAESAYLLGNGQGKVRMAKTGGARQKPSWRLLFVSSGEVTVAGHAAAAGKRIKGGVEVRVLNIPADAGRGLGLFEDLHGRPSADAFAREMKAAAVQTYGHPFREFVGKLIESHEAVKLVRQVKEAFIVRYVPDGATGEVLRAAERFALIGAAGTLATEWGITGWDGNEAMDAAARCFRDWITERGTSGSSDAEASVQQVRMFIEEHGASRFQSTEETAKSERVVNRAGFRRVGSDGITEYLIMPQVFKSEVCKGFNHRHVREELKRRGALVRQEPDWTIKPRLPEVGSVRVYCVRSSIFEVDACL